MKHSEWNALSDDERKNAGWHRHPRVRTATLYSIAFIVGLIIVIFGISKNSTVHLNRRPTANEAFSMAKLFVKDSLKQPAIAKFPGNDYKSTIDTAGNNYQVQSFVKIESEGGKMIRSDWQAKLKYVGGDWSDRNSWQVISINITQ